MKYILTIMVLCTAMLAQEKSTLKISGVAFGDYFYNVTRDTSTALSAPAVGTGTVKNYNGFQFRRINIIIDNDITEKFSFRFRFENDQSTVFTGGKVGVFVKDAYLKWKGIFSGSDLTIGIQPTPAFEASEGVWGYRSLEKTIQDLRGAVSSRDFGLSLRGKIDEEGMFSYWFLVGNNAGTGAAESDKYKRWYLSLQAKPFTNFVVTVFSDYSAIAPGVKGADKDKATTTLFAGYNVKGEYSIGVEAFSQSGKNGYTTVTPNVSTATLVSQGYSIFGSYFVTPEIAGVVRYDMYDPNTAGNKKADVKNLLIAGASWAVDKNVWIQPNIEYETYEGVTGYSPEAALTARLTFSTTF